MKTSLLPMAIAICLAALLLTPLAVWAQEDTAKGSASITFYARESPEVPGGGGSGSGGSGGGRDTNRDTENRHRRGQEPVTVDRSRQPVTVLIPDNPEQALGPLPKTGGGTPGGRILLGAGCAFLGVAAALLAGTHSHRWNY